MVPNNSSVLAIEWDRTELRYVWANRTSRRPVVRAIGRVQVEGTDENPVSSESLLAELRKTLRAKNAKVVAVVSRSDVDEFEATLPPAAADELGFLVANEAHKHNPATTDDDQIDFLTMEQHADKTRRVSIVVLNHAQHQRWVDNCERQSWKLASIQLRHIATTRLLGKLVDLTAQPRSIVLSISHSDADLVILERDQIALVRTIHLSPELESGPLVEKLSVEIQRSLMVTSKPDHPEDIGLSTLYFFGRTEDQNALRDQLAKSLQRPVQLLDPMLPFSVSRRKLPDRVHQFAGLLGSLIPQPAAMTIDLQTPKCVRKVNHWRTRAIVYGVAAALLLGLFAGWGFNNVSQARQRNSQLKADLAKIQKQVDDLQSKLTVVDYYENWIKDDVNWLDELRELSLDFPERSKIQVKSMTISTGTSSDGIIAMNLRAKDNSVIAQLEQTVRDESHQIRINQLSQNESDKDFPWQFGATILVRRRDPSSFENTAPANTKPPITEPTPTAAANDVESGGAP